MYNELQKRIADPIEMSKVGEVFSLKVSINSTQPYAISILTILIRLKKYRRYIKRTALVIKRPSNYFKN